MNLYRWENVVEKTVQVYKKVQKIEKIEKRREIILKRKKELFERFGVEIPFDMCTILGVNILVADMERMVDFVEKDVKKLKGEHVCVSNGHTTVTAFEDEEYRKIQNGASAEFSEDGELAIYCKQEKEDLKRHSGSQDLILWDKNVSIVSTSVVTYYFPCVRSWN